jgi:hypothetical protein
MRRHPGVGDIMLEEKGDGCIARPASGLPVPSTLPATVPRSHLALATPVYFLVRSQLLTCVVPLPMGRDIHWVSR